MADNVEPAGWRAHKPTRGALVTLTLAALIVLLIAARAEASTIKVNDGGDVLTEHAGICQLRQAILASIERRTIGSCAAGSGNDTIVIGVPKVTLAVKGSEENNSVVGDLDLEGKLTIVGQPGGTTIDGSQIADRVFDVRAGAEATLENLTVTGGAIPPEVATSDIAGEDGGGIRNAGTLVLRDVTVSGNSAGDGASANNIKAEPGANGGSGGGIASSGALTVSDCSIIDNSSGNGNAGSTAPDAYYGGAGGAGGGIESSGKTTIVDSIISGNRTGDGGTGGVGQGQNGPSGGSGFAEAGGTGMAGSGGTGGPGGGLAVEGGTLSISGSLISENQTGSGGAGGGAHGGTGGSGGAGGEAGNGGSASAGNGGSGGVGGGVYTGYLVESARIVSDTITGNTNGAGGAGGEAVGGDSGSSGSAINGEFGNGGNAQGGSGGADGSDAGVAGSGTTKATFLADTITNNVASEAFVPSGDGIGGKNLLIFEGSPGKGEFGEFGAIGKDGGLGSAVLEDSIVAFNKPTQCESLVYLLDAPAVNLSFPEGGCNGVLANPQLGPLADNGGPTKTFALAPGSPAVNEVPAAGAECPAFDQRGVPRPQGPACDAGAYELVVSGPSMPGPKPGPVGASPLSSSLMVHPRPPALSKLELRPASFRPISKHRGKHGGTSISWSDSQAALSTFTVQREVRGIRVGKACAAPSKRHAKDKAKRCLRYVALTGSFSHTDRAGENSLRWSGDLRGKPLASGSYRLQARASLNGSSSSVLSRSFAIVR